MNLHSTSNPNAQSTWKSAVLRGLAPDGGLYIPTVLPTFDEKSHEMLRALPFPHMCAEILSTFIGDEIERSEVDRLCEDSFNFPLPLISLNENTQVLELFHGPTCAFKDFGARFMARLFRHFWGGQDRPLTVLVATSGDTGSAVAQAFYDTSPSPSIRVVVMFPKGKVSEVQRRQMTSLGHNVIALEVDGTFDDCQSLAKRALRDERLLARTALTSANSINIARLLPQMLYYAFVLLRFQENPVVVVPSGNLGNITGGLLAQRCGFKARHWIAACNANRTFPDFLSSGKFVPASSIETISNAMDVGNPSNLARITALCGEAPPPNLLSGYTISDDHTLEEMTSTFRQTGYILDPHTAVAARALKEYRAHHNRTLQAILVATAHPAKFTSVVRRAIQSEPPLPRQLESALQKPEFSVPLPNSYEALVERLIELTRGHTAGTPLIQPKKSSQV
jgi:threonine synthase